MSYDYLFITADDYGYNKHVNKAIIKCCELGIINQIAILPTHVSKKDIQKLNAFQLNKAVHFNFHEGTPLSREMKRFLGSDTFPFKKSWRKYINSIPFSVIKAELDAQFDFVAKHTTIDYCTFHTFYPFIISKKFYTAYVEFAQSKNIPYRSAKGRTFFISPHKLCLSKSVLEFVYLLATNIGFLREALHIQKISKNSPICDGSFYKNGLDIPLIYRKAMLAEFKGEMIAHPTTDPLVLDRYKEYLGLIKLQMVNEKA